MIKLVIDANILFAALIKNSKTAELILEKQITLFAPEYLIEEFGKYRSIILRKMHRTEDEFNRFLKILRRRTRIIKKEVIEPFIKSAIQFSPDPKDSLYFALALRLKIPIWSNDKRLKNQNEVQILNTNELIRNFL